MHQQRFERVLYLLSPSRWLGRIRHPGQISRTILKILRNPRIIPLLMAIRNVEGYIEVDLGLLLYDSVLKAKSSSPNVVEVGAYKGLSTCCLSLAASRVGKRVKSFELFSGLPTRDPILDASFHVGQYSSDVAEYEANVTKYGRRDCVDLIIGDARQTLLPAIANDGFCVAFLDADVYEVTKECLSQLWSVAKGNEVIILHDAECQGVSKAIEEFHALSKHVVNQTNITSGTCIVAVLNIPAGSGI